MSKPKAGARGSGVPASRPTQAAGRPVATDGITITRWALGVSLSIALAVLTGVFTLLWDEATTLRETQVEVVSRVSRLDGRVAGLERQIQDFREEVRADMTEFRADMKEFRADIRQLAEIIRARGGPPGP